MPRFAILRKTLAPLFFLDTVKRYQGKTALMKIKAARLYVQGVQKMRIAILGGLSVIFAFVLLGSGLFLVHTAIFTYSLWSFKIKFVAALLLGAVELLGAAGILFYLMSEEIWVKFTGIDKVVDSISKERRSHEIKTDEKERE